MELKISWRICYIVECFLW